MWRKGHVPLMVLCLLLASCSKDDQRPRGWPDGAAPPDLGLTLDTLLTDLGALPDGLPANPNGPVIQVLAPTEGGTIVGDTLRVQAKITDAEGVDAQSVTVALQKEKEVSMSLTSTPDVYEAIIDVSQLNDKIRLIVYAKDLANNANSKVVDFMRDPGPRILYLSPAMDSRHRSSVSVQVMVTDRGKITKFAVRIGSYPLTLSATKNTDQQQLWVGTIKFDDKLFNPALSGQQVLIADAQNANGATSSEKRAFFVDDRGPDITIDSQQPGELIGGIIKLQAKVSDPAGVLPSTVRCVIGNNLNTRVVNLEPAVSNADTYTGQFDTRTLTQYDIWPVMSFRAADKLGNESTVDIQVALDNGQPIVELNPPRDYFHVRLKQDIYQCSHPFDPVGSFAANDLEQVPQIQELSARIEDQGNHAPSSIYIPIATVDKQTVQLFVLDDTNQPVVVDTDGDGYCDDINPEIVPVGSTPGPNQAVIVDLAKVGPEGAADFSTPLSPAYTRPRGACDEWGDDEKPPQTLCYSTPMTVATQYLVAGEPSIYSIPPVVSGYKGYQCVGLPFDFRANNIQDGWACVAVRAYDKLGNRGVSMPLRLSVNKSWLSTIATKVSPALAAEAPSCTGTLNKATGKVSGTPGCAFRSPRKTVPVGAICDFDYCSNCSAYTRTLVEFPQTFDHCEALLKD